MPEPLPSNKNKAKPSAQTETVVFAFKGIKKYSTGDGEFVDMPEGWEFVPSGDATLTRRLKAAAPDYWVVKCVFGRNKINNIGLCAPVGFAAQIAEDLKKERETPEYQKKLTASRKRRDQKQEKYQEDFKTAVLAFLDFHPRWKDLAEKFATAVTEFTTPIGSGTVARTESIPIEERARAAVIAWMRHNTTNYDRRYIPRYAGSRREVRHELAVESLALLKDYRWGVEVSPLKCPLQKALARLEAKQKKTNPPEEQETTTAL